ncbi:unnamed protein product [Dicrocoelium dendriticum]|nr:unnamed protein product [Dicrocoelium dendriticum]
MKKGTAVSSDGPPVSREKNSVLKELSSEDRTKMRNTVNELRKSRTNGETNLHIVDFQVVQKVQRSRRKPVYPPRDLKTRTKDGLQVIIIIIVIIHVSWR